MFENGYPVGCGVLLHNGCWWAAYDADGIFFWSGMTKEEAERHLWEHLHADEFWKNLPVVDLSAYEGRN